jgi:hypothetical protein
MMVQAAGLQKVGQVGVCCDLLSRVDRGSDIPTTALIEQCAKEKLAQ